MVRLELNGRIPVAPRTFVNTSAVARDPAAIPIAGLRHGALTVDKALPGAHEEGDVALDS